MKTILAVLMLFSASTALSASKTQNFSFQYKAKQYKSFTIVRAASNKEEAFRLAAKDCFKHLTNNKYPGEEKGLEIIDICANPKI
ncbi:MAG: hypothetical protein K0R29_1414 [Pseudobdellovibrio sp.]|jgi:hypothetical protein|nr:hypothetical protein [Pseudobdellovibrio sp.]